MIPSRHCKTWSTFYRRPARRQGLLEPQLLLGSDLLCVEGRYLLIRESKCRLLPGLTESSKPNECLCCDDSYNGCTKQPGHMLSSSMTQSALGWPDQYPDQEKGYQKRWWRNCLFFRNLKINIMLTLMTRA